MRKQLDELPLSKIWLILGLIIFIGSLILISPETRSTEQLEGLNKRLEVELDNQLIVIQGNTIKAIIPPVILEYQTLGMLVERIIQCESSNRHEGIWGDINYKYPAYGIAQFQERTFNWLAKLSGEKGLSWKNKQDQIWLLNWAIENGWGHLWTCYRKIKQRSKTKETR